MEERKAQHGGDHTFEAFGEVMAALFPDGIKISDPRDYTKLGLLQMQIHKLCRLAGGLFGSKANPDNAHDLGNYSFIMEAYIRNTNATCPVCNNTIEGTAYVMDSGFYHPSCAGEL